YLKQMNNLAPALITDVKKTLGLAGKKVNQMSLKELMQMTTELNKRIDFLEENGYVEFYSKMRPPTEEELREMVRGTIDERKTKLQKISQSFSDFVNDIPKKLFVSMYERIENISMPIAIGFRRKDFNTAKFLNE